MTAPNPSLAIRMFAIDWEWIVAVGAYSNNLYHICPSGTYCDVKVDPANYIWECHNCKASATYTVRRIYQETNQRYSGIKPRYRRPITE